MRCLLRCSVLVVLFSSLFLLANRFRNLEVGDRLGQIKFGPKFLIVNVVLCYQHRYVHRSPSVWRSACASLEPNHQPPVTAAGLLQPFFSVLFVFQGQFAQRENNFLSKVEEKSDMGNEFFV
ncbi:hypothetical protein FCM35_KLT11888 [Carex littledalei]|uniref:Secreted protein n=1 Tax=Carex littledalei TaxID=544730 RepID=A0A833QM32_9POAL|nr:hypothetical protein FCM35_KLT11888 [Carex littledalei]